MLTKDFVEKQQPENTHTLSALLEVARVRHLYFLRPT